MITRFLLLEIKYVRYFKLHFIKYFFFFPEFLGRKRIIFHIILRLANSSFNNNIKRMQIAVLYTVVTIVNVRFDCYIVLLAVIIHTHETNARALTIRV